ncbi:flavodoxin family protein [Cellulomonas gelida]|uniref:Flavodoxin n=1 Tax=Cellulomonas gelida TaxID=1712 RepID=A0A4Y3KQ81_9CELL|nr:flavodoxin family protein [Cellulomonas gelida]GEA85038.1 flavodoxin [Cellulomonas gelida]GGL30952.1 flavodoxin [Cellulomonas gelida]
MVFESMFGCTRAVAESIAEGMTAAGLPTVVLDVDDVLAHDDVVARARLLVVGAPTHMRGLSTPRSRALARARGGQGDLGVHEWLDALPGLSGRSTAVFDTRSWSRFAGSAGSRIEKLLRRRGAEIIAPTQAFGIEGGEDGRATIDDAQLQLARAWGGSLAAHLLSPVH